MLISIVSQRFTVVWIYCSGVYCRVTFIVFPMAVRPGNSSLCKRSYDHGPLSLRMCLSHLRSRFSAIRRRHNIIMYHCIIRHPFVALRFIWHTLVGSLPVFDAHASTLRTGGGQGELRLPAPVPARGPPRQSIICRI